MTEKIVKKLREEPHNRQAPELVTQPGRPIQEYYWCSRGLRRSPTLHLVQQNNDCLSGLAICGVKHPRQLWIRESKQLQAKPGHHCRNCLKLLDLERLKADGKKVVKPEPIPSTYKCVLEPCRFCTEQVAGPISLEHKLVDGVAYYHVLCPACGACGPGCLSKETAVVAWNSKRIRRRGKP